MLIFPRAYAHHGEFSLADVGDCLIGTALLPLFQYVQHTVKVDGSAAHGVSEGRRNIVDYQIAMGASKGIFVKFLYPGLALRSFLLQAGIYRAQELTPLQT